MSSTGTTFEDRARPATAVAVVVVMVASMMALVAVRSDAQTASPPSAPRDVIGAPQDRAVTLAWTAPAQTGGSAISGYLAASVPEGSLCSPPNGQQRTCTVRGLTNGRAYAFRVSATNAEGFGPASALSPLYRPRPAVLPPNGFADVERNTYYAVPVDWARLFGLTTGVGGSNAFAPFDPLLRSQIIAFLWRFGDSPGGYGPHGFADVPGGTFYEDALRWARATDVTNGVGNNFYAPQNTVTRAEMVTFLWRLSGARSGFVPHGFSDAQAGTFYDHALRWARALGITTGVAGSDRFEPHRPVTRAEAAAFLYRLARTRAAWVVPDAAPSTVLFPRIGVPAGEVPEPPGGGTDGGGDDGGGDGGDGGGADNGDGGMPGGSDGGSDGGGSDGGPGGGSDGGGSDGGSDGGGSDGGSDGAGSDGGGSDGAV